MDARDRQIDRELADYHAAARVFGISLEIEKKKESTSDVLDELDRILRGPSSSPSAGQKAAAVRAEVPPIRQIVLDCLKLAGTQDSKAAAIQAHIEQTYRVKIHDKTVGMTLYRLSTEGLVRRDGRTWFIAPKAMNPGAATPGSEVEAT